MENCSDEGKNSRKVVSMPAQKQVVPAIDSHGVYFILQCSENEVMLDFVNQDSFWHPRFRFRDQCCITAAVIKF